MGREVEWWEKRVVGGKSPDDEDPRDLRRAAQHDERDPDPHPGGAPERHDRAPSREREQDDDDETEPEQRVLAGEREDDGRDADPPDQPPVRRRAPGDLVHEHGPGGPEREPGRDLGAVRVHRRVQEQHHRRERAQEAEQPQARRRPPAQARDRGGQQRRHQGDRDQAHGVERFRAGRHRPGQQADERVVRRRVPGHVGHHGNDAGRAREVEARGGDLLLEREAAGVRVAVELGCVDRAVRAPLAVAGTDRGALGVREPIADQLAARDRAGGDDVVALVGRPGGHRPQCPEAPQRREQHERHPPRGSRRPAHPRQHPFPPAAWLVSPKRGSIAPRTNVAPTACGGRRAP